MNRCNKLYDDITNRIIEKLKDGILPWRKSWEYGLPQNFITKKVYQGINYLNLCFEDYPSKYYLTYLQCQNKDGHVNKGAKSKSIIYWKISEIDNGDIVKKVPLLRLSNVFNLSQTSLFDDSEMVITDNTSCKSIIDNMTNMPTIKHNFNRCYYSPAEDYISIPPMIDFNNTDEYYSSLFHELAHATGHPSRLDRLSGDSIDQAEEELVAELSSSYLCSIAGIENSVIDNQASYIQSWLSELENDNMYLVRASQKAKLAADWLISKDSSNNSITGNKHLHYNVY